MSASTKEETKIFILKSRDSGDKVNKFSKKIEEEINKYTISAVKSVNEKNIYSIEDALNKKSIIIVFNEKLEEDKKIISFLEKAVKEEALIFPIAMDRDTRIPLKVISERQSYDIYEELRNRDLNEEYLDTIAEIFSRKIIEHLMPTIFSEEGMVFVSHRRIDGEEIAAKLCDMIEKQFRKTKIFRDVVNVQVGEEAQKEIDSAMSKSDAFIFLHTEESGKSKWVQKEIIYAMLRHIPIIWIQIDNAELSDLKFRPSEKPILKYASSDFKDERKLLKIVDEIMKITLDKIISKNNEIYSFLKDIKELFGKKIEKVDQNNLIYKITTQRKNYYYPQREIKQYIQLYGRTPLEKDISNLEIVIPEKPDLYDSRILLTDRIIRNENKNGTIIDSFENFYSNWYNFFKEEKKGAKNMEIVISGAFPDGDEIYKQNLIDAIIIFARSIIKDGYTLTFGAHPTFQELFFEIAKEVSPKHYKERVKMFISKWFEESYNSQKEYFKLKTQIYEISKENSLNESLTSMRKEMIQRKEVIALVCLGGKIKSNKKEEGVREEIALAQEKGIPVFVVGTVGGCTSEIAMEYEKNNWKNLNSAPTELNNLFFKNIDYSFITKEFLKYLKNNKK